MLGLHFLLAVALAAFADTLSIAGVVTAFVLIYLVLKLSAGLLGMSGYMRRMDLGMRFVLWYIWEVVRASLDVARVVFAKDCEPSPAIIKMKLRRHDERIATLIGALLTLTPGTMALEYEPETAEMYIHVLDATSSETAEAGIREIEARLLEWMGLDDEGLAATESHKENA